MLQKVCESSTFLSEEPLENCRRSHLMSKIPQGLTVILVQGNSAREYVIADGHTDDVRQTLGKYKDGRKICGLKWYECLVWKSVCLTSGTEKRIPMKEKNGMTVGLL